LKKHGAGWWIFETILVLSLVYVSLDWFAGAGVWCESLTLSGGGWC
jgi:hypothetical protein